MGPPRFSIVLMIFLYINAEVFAERVPLIPLEPLNHPAEFRSGSGSRRSSDKKHQLLREYVDYVNDQVREPRTPEERAVVISETQKRLTPFIEMHKIDIKRLLYAIDKCLIAMDLLTINKKMDTSEGRIRNARAHIPFGVYVSPEFKCNGYSYYIASAHSQKDVQNFLSSERRPQCYNFMDTFVFGGYYHKRGEKTYNGPHGETFMMESSQGMQCKADEWGDTTCIYKLRPLPQFPESIQYQVKTSYFCGDYRYYLPPAARRLYCVFSIVRSRFELWFSHAGSYYVASGTDLMYPNGQKMYSDEEWARMACTEYVCKWHHNQNRRQGGVNTDSYGAS